MPEGDTLARTAAGLRPYLVGRTVQSARARGPGAVPQVERVVGARIDAVDALGKNLLIRFDNGLELRTHLRMNGSWHRYRPGERWKRPASRARVVLEVPGAVAVCFDAPVVELFERRAEAVHRPLAALGPDILASGFVAEGAAEAMRRLRSPERAPQPIAEAIVDQRVLAGIGNIYRSESLFLERMDPSATVGSLDDDSLARLIETARRLLAASVAGAPTTAIDSRNGRRGGAWVYGRTGLPCRRCRTPIASRVEGELARRIYWCPSCQRATGPIQTDEAFQRDTRLLAARRPTGAER